MLGTDEKALYCVAVIQKKDPSPLPGSSPPRTSGRNVLPGLESQCAITLAPGTCLVSKHYEHYSNIYSHLYAQPYMCVCEQLLIFHHSVLSTFST